MPKQVEDKLKREAVAKHLTGRAAQAYVFGTMNRAGLLKRSTPKRSPGADGDQDGE